MARAALNRCETFPIFAVDDLTKLRNEAPKGEVQASETSDEQCQPRLTPSHWCIDRNQDLEDKVKRLQDNQQQSYGLRMAWWICWFATFLHGLEVSNTFFKVCWRLLACALRISMLKHRHFLFLEWFEVNLIFFGRCVFCDGYPCNSRRCVNLDIYQGFLRRYNGPSQKTRPRARFLRR